jgi:hypothetical protein
VHHQTFEQVAKLTNAVAFTHDEGHPLTVLITVLWSHFPGFRENRLSAMATRFQDRLGRWLRRHGVELRAVWARERGGNKGHHLHMLANVPVRLVEDLEGYLTNSFSISPNGLAFSYPRFGMQSIPPRAAAFSGLAE